MRGDGAILVTGGAGFIGSALVRHLIATTAARVVTVDKLTYAANLHNLAPVAGTPRHILERADICDPAAMAAVFARHRPRAVMHLAAETHVDRSIDGPAAFVQTNVVGTAVLLQVALEYWQGLSAGERDAFRFHHVSTDEVFGSLGAEGRFREDSPYDPRSPYSASKAGADHLVRAWHHTYGLPTVVSNCSNNYGPYQFPEKLVPLVILNGIAGRPLPVYGSGANVRDWLYVDDHAAALAVILARGRPGESYNVGGRSECTNLDMVQALCRLLDDRLGGTHADLITFVADRPGHDFRYAIDDGKAAAELGIAPAVGLEDGLARTVDWYLANEDWWRPLVDERYDGRRLGLTARQAEGCTGT